MAKNAFTDWDTVANNNTDVAGISIAENATPPQNINNGMRAMMAQLAAAGFVTIIRRQVFTASGTYTPNANMVYCEIECQGAGAGGGGVTGAANRVYVGGGGGGGSLSRKLASKADIGASKAVTIGAAGTGVSGANGTDGGDTSVGVLCIGKGGQQGSRSPAGSGTPGHGGANGTGDATYQGGNGLPGLIVGTAGVITVTTGGGGGSSMYGAGGLGPITAGGSVSAGSLVATGYGGGGAGNGDVNSATTAAGGNGSPGLVIITEYCTK